MYRIGQGYDLHKLTGERALILGGIEVPHTRGLLGHSDADVLVHAIMDAMLGALALGDIGQHFPPSDNTYKDISSIVLLKAVQTLIAQNGYAINNIDSTILAQEPMLAKFIPKMKQQISKILDIGINDISVKATTTEGLGPIGEKEAIAAQAVVMLKQLPQGTCCDICNAGD